MDTVLAISNILNNIYNVLNTPIPITSNISVSLWGIIIASLIFGLFCWFIHRLFD